MAASTDLRLASVQGLSEFLIAQGFSEEDAMEFSKRNIDGDIFLTMSREDIAAVFPQPEKFVLGMNLYKLVQSFRRTSSSDNLTDIDDIGSTSSSNSGRKRSSLGSKSIGTTSASGSAPKVPRLISTSKSFTLPTFSRDVARCISQDSFYTPAQRNKIIRESCTALSGYCRELGRDVTLQDKSNLAKKLCELCKSLCDPCADKPESGLYGQIVKWFHNHAHIERKILGETTSSKGKKSKKITKFKTEEDDIAVKEHIKELEKESKKKSRDLNKLARLQSLTFHARQQGQQEMASSRAKKRIEQFPHMKKAPYLVEEMYLHLGYTFDDKAAILAQLRVLVERWLLKLMPAMVAFGREMELGAPEEDDDTNVLAEFCLDLLISKLKVRGTSFKERKEAILCVTQSTEEGLSKLNTHPYILAIGSTSQISSMVIVSDRKVITDSVCPENGHILNGLITLIAVHYAYSLAYNPIVRKVMEFLQEKLVLDVFPTSHKRSIAYSNLFCVITCFESKLEMQSETQPSDVDEDEDLTRAEFIFIE